MTSDSSKRSEEFIKLPEEDESSSSSGNHFSADLRGFGPIGILIILLILLSGNVTIGNIVIPFGAALVLIWVRWSHTPWRDIGYVRPKS